MSCRASARFKPNTSPAGCSIFLLMALGEVLLAVGQLPVSAPIRQRWVLVPGMWGNALPLRATGFHPAKGVPVREPPSLGEGRNVHPCSREESWHSEDVSSLQPQAEALSALSAGANRTPACPRQRCPVEELAAGFPWGKSCLCKAAGSGAPACTVTADLCFHRDFLMCLPAKAAPGESGTGGQGQKFYQQRNVGTVFVSLTLPPSQKNQKAG